jgi:3-hydroxyacyl-CoA dehydrogenase/enoyl-CoA hydratase/3-hydroxybutyryl-CoA epimerase
MAYENFTLAIDTDGIALVTWQMAGRSMNVITVSVMDELERLIGEFSSNAAIKGVIITSGKETFSGGADITLLQTLMESFHRLAAKEGKQAAVAMLFDQGGRLGRLLRSLETCGKPIVAAMTGTTLGGAFELVLACHRRIAADVPGAQIGLPEVRIGLIPGAGGSQRVARLAGNQEALTMMLRGEHLSPAKAKAMNLVDEVVPRTELIDAARRWLKESPRATQPWDTPDFRPPGGRVYSPAGMQFWPAAAGLYRRETYDNYPAARAILSCVYEGLQLPFDQALRVEARYFTHILQTKEAAAMARTLFISMQALNKLTRRPASAGPSTLTRIGIVGAGFMGAGIADVSARAGLEVVLIDRDQAAADAGKARARAAMEKDASRGRLSPADKDAALARIAPTADYNALGGCDLVIEAVFEDRAVKEKTIRAAESVLGDKGVLASNTSTLPITSLAEYAKRSDRFIGIHFFSPVERMMLVEVILGKNTGDAALAAALDYVRRIRKTPIVVNDSRAFYTSRVVETYIGEGHMMLTEGVPAAMIENVARMAGMPVGPLALNDEVAIDLTLKIMTATRKDLGDAAVPDDEWRLINGMIERGRLGRKNGKGFYDYPEGGKKKLWPGLADLFPPTDDVDAIEIATLKERFLVRQAVEAARCFAEGVITDVREADVGSVLGFGFPPFTGGTLSYIDFMGTDAFVALCRRLAGEYGPRFEPPALLTEMAAKGETFYGRFAPATQARAA